MKLTPQVRSILWIFAWALCFSGAVSLVKLIPKINTATIISGRFLISFMLMLPLIARSGAGAFKSQQLPRQILNSVFRTGAIWSTYYAYAKLPMALVASIGFTDPMIAITLAILLLRERVGWRKWVAVLVGYLGVLVMVHPDSIVFSGAIIIALLANFGSSLSKIITKELTRTDKTFLIMFYSNAIGLVLSVILAGIDFVMPSGEELLILLGVGVLGTLSQFSYLRALYHGNVSLVAPFEYSRLLFAVAIGYLFFAETPSSYVILGGLIIVCSSAYLTLREITRRAPQ